MKRTHIAAIALLGIAAGILVAVALYQANPGGVAVSGVGKSTGTANIGGAFTLTDHTGKRVSEKDYAGKFMLVFFGFTHCPDVCPTELQVISAALDQLGDKAKAIQPLFVTIDPERDNAEILAEYVSNFHESIKGLTGTPEEIASVAKKYHVYYRRVDDKDAADEYTMDHSAIVYLMDKSGKFLTHFAYGTKFEDMAGRLEKEVDKTS